MVTTLLLTVHTLRNIHSNARENIIRTREKRKASYFFVAHSVYIYIYIYIYIYRVGLAHPVCVCVYMYIYIYIHIQNGPRKSSPGP